jgi:hypothetical protein
MSDGLELIRYKRILGRWCYGWVGGWAACRVTRLGEFSPFKRLFTLAFFKITFLYNIFLPLFLQKHM